MMDNVLDTLLEEVPVVTDGAWGTQLQARGLPLGACPDAWNLDRPEAVEEVARAYVAAGSRVILTNTFGASRIALRRFGLEDRADDINRVGAEISARAAGNAAIVFGSIGPTGVMLAMGEVPPDEVAGAFCEQAESLAEGGARGLVVETMTDLHEATIAVQAARTVGLPVVACMAYGSGKDGDRTMMGVTPEQAVSALSDAGADVIGANCGSDMAAMHAVLLRMKAATDRPLWLKPNAGLPELVGGEPEYSMAADEFAAQAVALARNGAAFIGGCCGTSPAFIAALADALAPR